MIRQAQSIVANGELGRIQLVQVEYPHGAVESYHSVSHLLRAFMSSAPCIFIGYSHELQLWN